MSVRIVLDEPWAAVVAILVVVAAAVAQGWVQR